MAICGIKGYTRRDLELTHNLDQFKITLFDRFSPMLARGLNNAGAEMVAIAVESMHGKPFLAEHKLDGERLIMHRGES